MARSLVVASPLLSSPRRSASIGVGGWTKGSLERACRRPWRTVEGVQWYTDALVALNFDDKIEYIIFCTPRNQSHISQ
jgi:hypothetical protein